MSLKFNKETFTYENIFRTYWSRNLDRYVEIFSQVGIDFKSKVVQTHYGDDHDTFKLTLNGPEDCFKAAVITLESEVYNDDAEFCYWSENAFYSESQLKGLSDEYIRKAKAKLKELQLKKNATLNEMQKALKELAQVLEINYSYEQFKALGESDNSETIFAQNVAFIEDNNKLYRAIIEAARNKSVEYNESAVRAIILSISMHYVNSKDSSILQEGSNVYNQYLNPEDEKTQRGHGTVLKAKKFELPELGTVYPYLEPEIEFPHLNQQKDYTIYYSGNKLFEANRVTIQINNVTDLKNKVNRLFLNHSKSKTVHATWLTFLRFLKDSVVAIYNKIMAVLKNAIISNNPVVKHSDLAENVDNVVKGESITKKAQLLHQFNSRPSPLVHIIYDQNLNTEEKEDLFAKLATAKPYRFDYQKQESDNNLEILSDSLVNNGSSEPSGSPLLHAVKNGTINMVKILLANKVNIEAKGTCFGVRGIHYYGVTALHIAVANNDVEKVKLLLQHGANVNACNERGQTPLFAVSSIEVFNLLIEKGANINHQAQNGQTPLHFASLHDKKDIVKELVKQPRLQINLGDELGNTALHVTAATCFKMDDNRSQHFFVFSAEDAKEKKDINLQIMSALIEKGADVNQANHRGYVPLHMAVSGPIGTVGYEAVSQSKLSNVTLMDYQHTLNQVKLLCHNGADVNKMSGKLVETDRFSSSKNKFHPTPSTTPLLALYSHDIGFSKEQNKKLAANRLEIAKYLIDKGADPTLSYQQDSYEYGIKQRAGRSILHQCANYADVNAFSFFISKGLDPNYQTSPSHDTPLHVFMDENASYYCSWREEIAKAFFSNVDMNKTKIISIEINYNNLPPRRGLHSSIVDLIFKGDNEISRKAVQMGLSADNTNQSKVLTEVYKAILNDKYAGKHYSVHIEIPVNALQNTYRYSPLSSGATYEAAELYQKSAKEQQETTNTFEIKM